jgi:hypothetical protein
MCNALTSNCYGKAYTKELWGILPIFRKGHIADYTSELDVKLLEEIEDGCHNFAEWTLDFGSSALSALSSCKGGIEG